MILESARCECHTQQAGQSLAHNEWLWSANFLLRRPEPLTFAPLTLYFESPDIGAHSPPYLLLDLFFKQLIKTTLLKCTIVCDNNLILNNKDDRRGTNS